MESRIWEELCETVFQNFYLTEYIDRKNFTLNSFEVGSFIFFVAGIFGWYQLPQHSKYWIILLVIIPNFNIQPLSLTSQRL